jgi:hypothetical protein
MHSEGCGVCGEELVYSQDQFRKQCVYCEAEFMSNVECPQGHFICDDCHRSPANAFIQRYCTTCQGTDPMKMAVEIMRNPVIKMHGPEHHFLVPAVLIASYYNFRNEKGEKRSKLAIARKRSEIVPGGFCGTHGACGAALGVGIFTSIITGATPLSEKEWSRSNQGTSESLAAIASMGGPRCCKRDTFIAIKKAVEFIRVQFDSPLPESDVVCEFYERNKQCLFDDCTFYPGK